MVHIFNYNKTPITFQQGDSVMVNATEMAKSFNKRPSDWFKNQATKDFVRELSNVRNLPFEKLYSVKEGAPETGGGTWLHEDVALEFARWLSPSFAIWCNDRIKQLLTTGVATIQDDDTAILHAMQVLQKRIDANKQQLLIAQQQNATLTEENKSLNKQNEALKKDSDYLNVILNSKKTVTISQIAQDYGLSAIGLNSLLRDMRIQRKINGQWVLYSPFIEKGYVHSEAVNITRSNGQPDVKLNTRWTQRGRLFLYEELKKRNIIPLIER